MTRGGKKFIYGLFYLSLLFLVGFGIFGLVSRDRQISPRADVQPAAILIRETDLYSVPPDTIFAAGVLRNPNTRFLLRRGVFTFKIYDVKGLLLKTVDSEVKNLPGESERIFYGVSLNTPMKSVGRVQLEIASAEWEAQGQIAQPERLLVKDGAHVVVGKNNIIVLGTIVNRSALDLSEAQVITVLRDKFGFKYLVTGTTISNVQKFSERDFEIILPFSAELAKKADGGAADVFVY